MIGELILIHIIYDKYAFIFECVLNLVKVTKRNDPKGEIETIIFQIITIVMYE